MASESFEVELDGAERVSGRFETPDGDARASAILLAHGAGFGMDSPWMERVARGLAGRGFPVMRFNYLYRERAQRTGKEKPPDRTAVLEATHARVLRALEERAGERRVLLAGKSLGGRMSTHLAAKGERCAGLVLFGYPLHPPGQKEKLRSEHFAAIAQPALFLQGTRDDFCDLELLGEALARYGGKATVHVIDGADHGFHVKRSTGRSDEDVLEELLERVDAWERSTFPA